MEEFCEKNWIKRKRFAYPGSLVVPGAGLIFLNRAGEALILLAAALLFVVVLPVSILVWLFGLWKTYQVAKEIEDELKQKVVA